MSLYLFYEDDESYGKFSTKSIEMNDSLNYNHQSQIETNLEYDLKTYFRKKVINDYEKNVNSLIPYNSEDNAYMDIPRTVAEDLNQLESDAENIWIDTVEAVDTEINDQSEEENFDTNNYEELSTLDNMLTVDDEVDFVYIESNYQELDINYYDIHYSTGYRQFVYNHKQDLLSDQYSWVLHKSHIL